MKTPWRFLAELTSRRKPSPAQLSLPAPAKEADAPANGALPAEISGESQKPAVAPVASGEPAAFHEAPAELAETIADSPRASRTRTTQRAKQSGTTAEPEIVTAAPLPGSTVFDDVAALDDEIKQLRAALAQKLSAQNAQLRMMLKRFNVS